MGERELVAMQAAVKAVLEQSAAAGGATPVDAHAALQELVHHYETLGGDASHEIAVQIARLGGAGAEKKAS